MARREHQFCLSHSEGEFSERYTTHEASSHFCLHKWIPVFEVESVTRLSAEEPLASDEDRVRQNESHVGRQPTQFPCASEEEGGAGVIHSAGLFRIRATLGILHLEDGSPWVSVLPFLF